MTRQEGVAEIPKIDLYLLNGVWTDRIIWERSAQTDNSISKVGGNPVRFDIQQLRCEISVYCAGTDPKHTLDWSTDGNGFGQHRTGVTGHVRPLLDRRLVVDASKLNEWHQDLSTDSRCGICWVVIKVVS